MAITAIPPDTAIPTMEPVLRLLSPPLLSPVFVAVLVVESLLVEVGGFVTVTMTVSPDASVVVDCEVAGGVLVGGGGVLVGEVGVAGGDVVVSVSEVFVGGGGVLVLLVFSGGAEDPEPVPVPVPVLVLDGVSVVLGGVGVTPPGGGS